MAFLKDALNKVKEVKNQATETYQAAKADGTIDALKDAGKAKIQEIKKNIGPK